MKRVVRFPEEPPALTDYKARFARAPRPPVWKDFKKNPGKKEVQNQLREDQRGLCAYCENTLVLQDESVEHFIARNVDHDKELEWANLLLCCGGGERPLPEDIEDGDSRHNPEGPKTCGHAKLKAREAILNPLQIPHSPRLFRFRSLTGEIEPDEVECQNAGIDPALARRTISVLNLRAGRLNRARLGILKTIEAQLNENGQTQPLSIERERELAEDYFQTTGPLPSFFTTIRFSLGDGAESHLSSIRYLG